MNQLFKVKRKNKFENSQRKRVEKAELDESIVKIGEKVKFWEEQDKLNRELIPRVLKNHGLIETLLSKEVKLSNDIIEIVDRIEINEARQAEIINDLSNLKEKFNSIDIDSIKKVSKTREITVIKEVLPYIAIVISVISLIIHVL